LQPDTREEKKRGEEKKRISGSEALQTKGAPASCSRRTDDQGEEEVVLQMMMLMGNCDDGHLQKHQLRQQGDGSSGGEQAHEQQEDEQTLYSSPNVVACKPADVSLQAWSTPSVSPTGKPSPSRSKHICGRHQTSALARLSGDTLALTCSPAQVRSKRESEWLSWLEAGQS
jgi:hypothetical protein